LQNAFLLSDPYFYMNLIINNIIIIIIIIIVVVSVVDDDDDIVFVDVNSSELFWSDFC